MLKLIMHFFMVVTLAIGFIALAAPSASAQNFAVQAQYESEYDYDDGGDTDFAFFAELGSYGRWRVAASYGRVWQPYVTAGWRPYYHGHWAWTDRGWMWVSYEPFGWAVYHYGYWAYEQPFGWVWIPAYDWAPCHVQWVMYDDYVSWAPLPPPGHRIHNPWVRSPYNVWITVNTVHFAEPKVARYHVSRPKFKATYVERNARMEAPDVTVVQRTRGRSVAKMKVDLEHTTSAGRELQRAKLPPEQERVVTKNYRSTPSRATVQGKTKYRSERGAKPERAKAPSKAQAEDARKNKGQGKGKGR